MRIRTEGYGFQEKWPAEGCNSHLQTGSRPAAVLVFAARKAVRRVCSLTCCFLFCLPLLFLSGCGKDQARETVLQVGFGPVIPAKVHHLPWTFAVR